MMAKFNDLFPALVECFAIILFGYVSGRLSIITPKQAGGIGKFVGTFALPALLFKNMVELDFGTVSWSFMVAVLVSKAIVFLVVLSFCLIMIKEKRISRGALYAIFTTQSNDFALGYPLVQALYGKTHPEFLQYIYLFAPISLLILNPIGFVLLEIDKHRAPEQDYMVLQQRVNSSCDEDKSLLIGESINAVDEDSIEANDNEEKFAPVENQEDQNRFTARTCLHVAKGVLLNPLVFMVFVGLAGHFIFNGKLPSIIGDTLGTLARSFSASALFYLGLTMVGKVSKQQGIGLVIPAFLIAAKIVLLPILIREFMFIFSNVLPVYRPDDIPMNSTNMTHYISTLADFGYLYGTFPTAPTLVIYAAKYGIEVDRLAAGMVFCTSLSAPIMYVSAWTLSMTQMSVDFFQKEVTEVNRDISIISLFCCVWCMVIFIIGHKFKRFPHAVTLGYIFAVFFSSLGTILWDGFRSNTSQGTRLFLFGMMYFGVKSTRFFTAFIALALVFALSRGQRWLWNHWWGFILTPFTAAFVVTLVLMSSTEMNISKEHDVFAYGKAQDIASLVAISFSFLITLLCLFVIFKMHGISNPDSTKSSLLRRTSTELLISDDENVLDAPRSFCLLGGGKCISGDIQKTRHIVLLLILAFSMATGICLILWRIASNKQDGVYFEVAFLDSVFNFGQGFFVFCVFGLDTDLIIDPFVRMYHKLRYGSEDITLPDLSTLDKAILIQCLQFARYHLDDCKLDIVRDRRSGLTLYPEVFTGKDFCTWLIDRGIVDDRTEARLYGQNLLMGRVLYHHTHKNYFHDQNYLYKFEEPKSCYRVVHTHISNSGLNSPASSPAPSNATNMPSTSSQYFAPSTSTRVLSPARRTYYGYSFEAHITGSDVEGLPASLCRHSQRRVRHSSNVLKSAESRDSSD